MQLIEFSCVSQGLILALWNNLKPFPIQGFIPGPIQGGVPQTPQECAPYKMPKERAWLWH